MGLWDWFMQRRKNKKSKLLHLTLEESKKKCEEIGATQEEIDFALKGVKYVCEKCGYHSGIVRRCPACNGLVRYHQLYERILENRELFKKRKWLPHKKYSKPIKGWYAKCNRRNPTEAEAKLWEELKRKKLGVKFRRQAVMFGWIADFWCPAKKLIIEVDGGYHKKPNQIKADNHRDKALNVFGIRTLRVKNDEIMNNMPEVLERIEKVLED